jgi:uroporphyrinogen-III decarboxylase
MNSRERVAKAMRHEIPDRVPVMCQLALGHYFLHSDQAPADIWFDSEVFVRTLAEFQQRYRFDGFLINLPGRPPDWRAYLTERRRVGDRCVLTWRDGTTTAFPADDNPHSVLAGDAELTRADPASVDLEDPATFRLPGYVWNTWHAPSLFDIAPDADLTDPAAYPDWLTRGLRVAREACPDVSVHVEVFSPFTHLLEFFGYQPALMAMLETPDLCLCLLERFAAMTAAQVQCYGSCQPDAILISSAFAGAGFISREMYRQFVLPYEQQVVEAIRRFAIPAYTHTCGAIGDRLDLMAQTGLDGIDTLDPPPLGTVDLAQAKAEFGQRLFFKGNLDAVNEMLRADESEFEQAVIERLRIGKPGSGYILSSACSVAPHVAPGRLLAMSELAERYGRYS